MRKQGVGPKSARQARIREAEAREQEAHLRELGSDLQTLESQKQTVGRLMLEMLSGYESVLRRVRTSGDRTLAHETAGNLKTLGSIYQALGQMSLVSAQEREFLTDYIAGLHEAANNLAVGQQKVDRLLKRATQQQKQLAQMQQRLASMGRLQVEESSFFDAPDKREAIRRRRDVDRKLRR